MWLTCACLVEELALSMSAFIIKLFMGSAPLGEVRRKQNLQLHPIPRFGEERLFLGNSGPARQLLMNGKATERRQRCYL